MAEPKITTIDYIEYNGELFQVGDIVDFVWKSGGSEKHMTGRLIETSPSGSLEIIKFDCSSKYHSNFESFNICNLISISHAEEQEE